MDALKALLRWISYLFHFVLSLLSLAVSGVAFISGGSSLRLGMLPWTEHTLIRVLFFGGLAGLAIVLLAMRGRLRLLFALWSFAILVLIVRGYFLVGYRFHSPQEFKVAIYLLAGAIISLLGALQLRVSRGKFRR